MRVCPLPLHDVFYCPVQLLVSESEDIGIPQVQIDLGGLLVRVIVDTTEDVLQAISLSDTFEIVGYTGDTIPFMQVLEGRGFIRSFFLIL